MGSSVDADVIIVGAGIAGLSCARQLMKENISFLLLEAGGKIGGRLKTENVDGFRLNYGFQVLQTAYPEAQRMLDFDRLALKPFAPGMMIRIGSKFYRISDPNDVHAMCGNTLTAPIGTLGDRLRILGLVRR